MNSSFLILILLILFYYMYILLNLENIVFFSLSLFKCRIETLNISGAVIKTQCFLFLGLLWYPEMFKPIGAPNCFLYNETHKYYHK